MQNLDKITDKIMAEANDRAQQILLAADSEAERITDDARESAILILEKAKKRADREALASAERAYSSADMKQREIMLATKVGLINKVFKEAHKRLLELPEEEYCTFAAHLLADAATERIEAAKHLRKTYGDSEDCCVDFEVIFRAEDKETRAPVIIKTAKALMRKKSATLGRTPFAQSDECASIDGGLILRYGDIETNCSIDAVIADARERLEGRVAEILFAPENDKDRAEETADDGSNENES